MQNRVAQDQSEGAGENTPTDVTPDWTTDAKDLLCPLCGYNLRGLSQPRCPECGFKFTWRELIDAEKNRHRYIFEHGSGHGITSFWKTYWRTCQPRRFWTDLNPAQPVRVGRLVEYWVLTVVITLALFTAPVVNDFVRDWQLIQSMGYFPRTFILRAFFPWLGWIAIFVIWPWLTLISLLVFRVSMRQAQIRTVHLIRTVIYSCDFGLLLTASFIAVFYNPPILAEGWLVLMAAVACSVITTYRLTIAFRKYLRVHLPLATVLASQVIAFLLTFLALLPLLDFSRRLY